MAREWFSIIVCLLWANVGYSHCTSDHVHLSGPWGSATFQVELAQTQAERAQGLMNRDEMALRSGMLFIFEDEAPRMFWMKNTRIPLDILYFDAQGDLVSIIKQAVPFDLTPLPSTGPSQYVLEINGGLSDRFRIGAGTQLGHPLIKNRTSQAICAQ